MRKLGNVQMELVSGGGDGGLTGSQVNALCTGGGAALFAGTILLGIGLATGGVGVFVAAGLTSYFGVNIGLICAMYG